MKRVYFSMAVILVGIVIGATLLTSDTPVSAASGSVTFSHATHKDLDCSTCHDAAKSSAASDNLLPAPEACVACHDQKDVRSFYDLTENASLSARSVASKDRHLLFSHAGHLVMKGMECKTCHVDILKDGGATYPPMETCSVCHDNGEGSESHVAPATFAVRTATNTCEACHTTLSGLMPKNHRISNFQRVHGQLISLGGPVSSCGMCHSENFCQSCHVPTNLVPPVSGRGTSDKMKNATVEGWPRAEKMDDAKVLTGQAMHPLTYRYTHGIDARAKTTRCETCHESATFCTPCHQNGYDISGVRILPQSHRLAGFVSITGGKAMNRHGRLAKQDMESCATCHEVDGGDPLCVKCHQGGPIND